MNDIDLSSYSNWDPIGDYTNRFAGILNGNGYVISNLTINRPNEKYIGLFGYVGDDNTTTKEEIKNLRLENVEITGSSYTGGIVGCFSYYEDDTIYGLNNCYVSGTIKGNGYVGGISGQGYRITDCHASATIISTEYRTGGIAGFVSEIENSYSTGNIYGTSVVGGLAGTTVYQAINCYSTGKVTGTERVGGLIGSGYAKNSYSTSDVNGTKDIGGLIGVITANGGTTSNCFYIGNITGKENIGGIAGSVYGQKIENCYSSGLILGDTNTGAIVGYANKYVAAPFPVVTYSYTKILNCIWDVQTTGQSTTFGTDVGGTIENNNIGLTTAQMENATNWAGWDDTVWDLSADAVFPPQFLWQKNLNSPTYPTDPDNPDESSSITGSVDVNTLPDKPFQGQQNGEIIFSDGTKVEIFDSDSRTEVLDKINNSGLDASIDKDGHIVIKKPDGSNISIESDSSGFSDHYGIPINKPSGGGQTPSVTPAGSIRLQIGYDEKNTSVIYLDTQFNLDAFAVDFSTSESCAGAIDDIDELLSKINEKRADFGAVLNRLSSISDSQVTAIENYTAAKSTIMDADIAEESANFVKSQILQQTSSALLAQSQNIHSSIALSLIQ